MGDRRVPTQVGTREDVQVLFCELDYLFLNQTTRSLKANGK